MGLTMHAIQTGWLQIKERHYINRSPGRLARLATWATDRRFHPRIPVLMWAIEHPEGVIVIDTGETAKANDPNYFPSGDRPFFTGNFRFEIGERDEAGPQLRAVGIDPADVRWVVMTHMHMDHSDGLYHFPNAEFIVSAAEWREVQRLKGFHGAVPSRWPDGFKPTLIGYDPTPVGRFDRSYGLTADGQVRIVPTPGHTLGHQSVLVEDEGQTVMFAGDTSFDIPRLLDGAPSGVAASARLVRETRRRIIEMSRAAPLVYLPSHDGESVARLAARTPLAV